MRPIAEIPDAFLDVRSDLGEPLPLLEAWLRRFGSRPMATDCRWLLIQHQLANHAAQADGLVRIGADPSRIHWLDIPYTSHPDLRAYVQTKLRLDGKNMVVCDDYNVLDAYAPYQHERTVRMMLELAQGGGPLIVLDDGAYAIEALAALRRERWPSPIAVVEQTTRGIIKIRESSALRAVVASLPFVNVAESVPKRTLEPPFIALSVCASLERKIRPLLRGRALRSCLVLGYGTIGEQVASYVAVQFGLPKHSIYVSDLDGDKCRVAEQRGFQPWNKKAEGPQFDLVLGCSGTASFGLGDYACLTRDQEALLASASSGAVELSRGAFIELCDASPLDDMRIRRERFDPKDLHADLHFDLVDRTAVFLNAGFPINFDGRITTTPARYIQPTPVMMCDAALHAARVVESGDRGAPWPSDEFCDWIDTSFREILGSDAHLLVPPSERAW